jgi:aminopeptidase 2
MLGRVGSLRAAWIFEAENTKTALKKYQVDLCASKAHELGWNFNDSDGHIEQQFKALLFGCAGLAGDEKIKAAAFEMLKKFKAGDKTAIHPNIRSSVYAICLTYGGADEYDVILNEYRTAATSDERNSALRALGRAQDPELIKRTLSMPLSDEVKGQDIYLPLGGLRTHKAGITALWHWMTENWAALEKKLPPGLTMLGSVVTICTSSFTHEGQSDKIKEFFEARSTKGFNQSLAQSLDSIKAKSMWLDRDIDDVGAWLKQHKYLE